MSDQKNQEQVLLSIALLLCAGIIFYNFFFVPTLSPTTIVYVDKKLNEDLESDDDNMETADSDRININTASVDELSDVLPGVGKVTAERIVEYREINGGFDAIDEIMEVKGIGEKSFEKIKDLICV